MTLYERFQHKYMDRIKEFWYLAPEWAELDKTRKEFGMTPLGLHRDQDWDIALKLVNGYLGFATPQYMSPLTHMVGPVIPEERRPLSREEETFLNAHQRVAYVAFGQVMMPDKRDIEMLLSSLLDQMEKKQLDGILWVRLKEAIQSIESEKRLFVKNIHRYLIAGKSYASSDLPNDFDLSLCMSGVHRHGYDIVPTSGLRPNDD